MVSKEESRLLATLPVFSALNSRQIKELLSNSHHIKLSKDQTLFNMGDIAHSFYLLTNGQVKFTRNSLEGVEKVLEIVRPGYFFAESVMFLTENRYPTNCVAVKQSEVISFNNQQFVKLLHESTELSMALLANLSKRLHQKVKEIDGLTLQNATIRVVNYLTSLFPDSSANSIKIELDTPKQTIASIISVTPETFSRILKELDDNGLLEIKRESVFIPDIKKLSEYAYSNQL